jgi:hypothetical protein
MADPIPCPKCGRLYSWDGKRCCRKDCRFGSTKKPLKTKVKVVGVYPVNATDSVHMVEVATQGSMSGIDFGDFTQEDPDLPKANWQVAYDERVLWERNERTRAVFFFHFLDFNKPLLFTGGQLTLPAPTAMPPRLSKFEYEPP